MKSAQFSICKSITSNAFFALVMGFTLTGCESPSTVKISPTNSTSTDTNKTISTNAAPIPTTGFRLSQAEMQDIANPNKLKWRIFYDKPSTGKDAKWFDAVKRGDLATVKYMVEHGQDIEAKDTGSLDQTALGWAAFIGYEDIFDYLIAKGANPWATDTGDVYNVLKSAVLGKNTAIVKKAHTLLKAKTDLNDQTLESDGETPIIIAASNDRIDNVKYLLSVGANPNLVSKKDQSPLSFACDRGYAEMQKLLIANGAINHRTGKPSCQ